MATIFNADFSTLGLDNPLLNATIGGKVWKKTLGDNIEGSAVGLKCEGVARTFYYAEGALPTQTQWGEVGLHTFVDNSLVGFHLHGDGLNRFEFSYLPESGVKILVVADGAPVIAFGPVALSLAEGDHTMRGGVTWDGSTHQLILKVDGVTKVTGTYAGLPGPGLALLDAQYIHDNDGTHITYFHVAELESDLGATEPPATEITFPITHPNIYFPPGVWDIADDESSVQTPYIDGYLKTSFQNSTLLKLEVITSHMEAAGIVSANYHKWGAILRYDNVIKRITGQIEPGQEEITISTTLDALKRYYLRFYVRSLMPTEDAWNGGYDVDYALRLGANIRLSEGATMEEPIVGDWVVWQFGDSTSLPFGNLGSGSAFIGDTEADTGWAALLAAVSGEEYGIFAVGSSGWGYGGHSYPPVITPGNAALSMWNQITSGRPRNGVPNEIRICLGRNDEYYTPTSDANVAIRLNAFHAAVRAGLGDGVLITVQIPFSQAKLSILTETVATLSATDPNVRIMNYGDPVKWGMSETTGGAAQVTSLDGVHFNSKGHALAAIAMVDAHGGSSGPDYRYFVGG